MDVLYSPQLDEIDTGGAGEGGGSGGGTAARYRLLRRVPEDGEGCRCYGIRISEQAVPGCQRFLSPESSQNAGLLPYL